VCYSALLHFFHHGAVWCSALGETNLGVTSKGQCCGVLQCAVMCFSVLCNEVCMFGEANLGVVSQVQVVLFVGDGEFKV